jgi:hypothetical protein
MPDRTPDATGPSDPASHPSADRLRAYLAEDLEPGDAGSVAAHLESCPGCVDRLDDLEGPVVLEPLPLDETPAWDERRMRRAVRRTVLRTAFNAACLLFVAAVALQMLGWYVLQPLLVDRGDRVAGSVAASIDVPVMTIPGAELGQAISNPGVIRRTTKVDLERAVGARFVQLGTFTTRLGPFGMSLPEDRPISPFGAWLDPMVTGDQTPVSFEPDRLGDGTAVTVELWWREPIDLATADAVDDVADDLALSWVGFRVPGGDRFIDPAWRLGYSTCSDIPEHLRAGWDEGSGDALSDVAVEVEVPVGDGRGGVEHALREVRRATANLAAIGWPGGGTTAYGALEDPAATAEVLASTEPAVDSVVITGPTRAVAAAVERYAPDQVDLLELDFDRGAPQVCL